MLFRSMGDGHAPSIGVMRKAHLVLVTAEHFTVSDQEAQAAIPLPLESGRGVEAIDAPPQSIAPVKVDRVCVVQARPERKEEAACPGERGWIDGVRCCGHGEKPASGDVVHQACAQAP